MSRLLGPSEGSRLVFRPAANGAPLLSAAGVAVTIWTAETGGALADILDVDDGIVAGAALQTDSNSMLPLFQFPDGVDTVWALVAGSTLRFPLYAREDDRLDTLDGQVEALEEDLAGLTTEVGIISSSEPHVLSGTGIDPTGVNDSTTALQAALSALSFGDVAFLPNGRYRITQITVPQGVTLKGSGWAWKRDSLELFGAPGYSTASNITGTVLVSAKTSSGGAVVCDTTITSNISIGDLFILGPGSGTSTGLALGSATHAIIDSTFRNIGIANFATGMTRDFVEDSSFEQIQIRGCTTGLSDGNNTNNNVHHMLGVSWCATGQVHRDSTCIGNLYLASLFQANTGLSLSIDGRLNVWETPYLENSSATNSVTYTAGALNCHVRDPEFGGSNYLTTIISFVSGARYCSITGFRVALTIANEGNQNTFWGNLGSYSGAGTNAYKIDPYNNRMSIPMSLSADLVMASGFLMRLDSGATGSRPTATGTRGAMWWDATIAKLIIRDGAGNWRDAMGNIV